MGLETFNTGDSRAEEFDGVAGEIERQAARNAIESRISPERLASFEAAKQKLVEIVLKRHENKEFHSGDPESGHSAEVEHASADVLDLVESLNPETITEDMEMARSLAALGHDIHIEATKNRDAGAQFGYGQIMRFRGWSEEDVPENLRPQLEEMNVKLGNERQSAEETKQIARETGLTDEGDVVETAIDQAIAATYPTADMGEVPEEQRLATVTNEEGIAEEVDVSEYLIAGKLALKFNQPYLTADSGLVEVSIAMADLMYPGRVSSEEFTKAGNAEFRELNFLIKEDLQEGIGSMSVERKKQIVAGVLSWVGTQAGFVLAQRERFNDLLDTNKTLAGLPNAEETKVALQSEYGMFDTNIVAAGERAKALSAEYGDLAGDNAFTDPGDNARLARLMVLMGYDESLLRLSETH